MNAQAGHPSWLDCPSAREAVSLRMDGELHPLEHGRALESHLAACAECRDYERALAGLATEFARLRAVELPLGLLPRIARRAPRPRWSYWTARVAAGFVGFVGLGGSLLLLERGGSTAAPERHFFERLSLESTAHETVFADLPEYQLLRRFSPDAEESR
jgi:hypothetical protein